MLTCIDEYKYTYLRRWPRKMGKRLKLTFSVTQRPMRLHKVSGEGGVWAYYSYGSFNCFRVKASGMIWPNGFWLVLKPQMADNDPVNRHSTLSDPTQGHGWGQETSLWFWREWCAQPKLDSMPALKLLNIAWVSMSKINKSSCLRGPVLNVNLKYEKRVKECQSG